MKKRGMKKSKKRSRRRREAETKSRKKRRSRNNKKKNYQIVNDKFKAINNELSSLIFLENMITSAHI